MSRKQKPGGKPPAGREEVEMIDGRVYFSDDQWLTVYRMWRGTSHRWRIVTSKQEADLARFLAVAQSSAGAGA